MTEIITAIIVGIFQVILSVNLIVRKKNGTAIVSEIISSIVLLFILNDMSVELHNPLLLGIALIEYLSVKIFLLMFMLLARYYSFYRIRAICRKGKKVDSKKFKFIRAINNAEYWPRLKLGLPGMANKTNARTKVKYDEKGFPKFKAYYTVKLRKKYFCESRTRHFFIANKILYRELPYNSNLRKMFTSRQIDELSEGKTPNGYTWHHHQDAGKLQLVDEEIHAKTYHYGGYSIWGSK